TTSTRDWSSDVCSSDLVCSAPCRCRSCARSRDPSQQRATADMPERDQPRRLSPCLPDWLQPFDEPAPPRRPVRETLRRGHPLNNGPEAELISRHMVSRRGLLAGSVTLLAAAFVT